MSSQARPVFAPLDMYSFASYVVSFRVTCWMFIILWLTYFILFNFLFRSASTSENISIATEFNFLAVSSSWYGYHCGCYGQSFGLLFAGFWVYLSLSFNETWLCSISKLPVVLQGLQVDVIIWHRMIYHLSGKAVAMYFYNSTAKAYVCNQGGTVPFFLQG